MRNKKTKEKQLDFRPIGKSIKAIRLQQGLTREELCNKIDIDPRYLTSIENEGQCPSLEVFYRIIKYFNLSVDQYFYPNVYVKTSTAVRIERILSKLDDDNLDVLLATAEAMSKKSKDNNKA